jgi:lipopolysaccharide export system protein LptA
MRLGFAVLLTASGLAGDLSGAAVQKTPAQKEQPIQIVSDRMEAFHDKRMVVFTGNAVATQGERTVRAERLTLFYKPKPDGQSRPGTGGTEDIERIEAKQNVRITEGERVVTGDEALFDQQTQQMTVTGNAVLREGANVIRGDRVVVFLEENRGVVYSGKNNRVTATVYPGEKQDSKPGSPARE